ncbi:MAG: zinc-ribbon domain-containing protein [Ruminococcus sp.]|nr:zinc-ribbon domain-containing protein [Ruminococcus sp.]MBR6967560.1 zinc-ribbon domain-containing protein [Ruminococcus sp.]
MTFFQYAIWNYEKNREKPDKYTVASNQKVWWKCDKCGHEWKSAISVITSGRWCAVGSTLTTIIWVMFGRLVLQQ